MLHEGVGSETLYPLSLFQKGIQVSDDKKKPELIFAPGCFDEFEGTQEELEELIAELKRLAESGELFDHVQVVNLEDVLNDFSEAEVADIIKEFEGNISGNTGKTLH